MEVHLKPEQEEFIQHRVTAGVYATADEAVQAAIELLEEQEARAGVSLRILSEASGAELVAAMQASPYKDIDLEPSRPHMPVRDILL